ncbi:2-oxo acid dehydrogenase subunit E2 [Amycolatopsis albispora]|uniref:Acyltransferase n=1 Tax=Amycolatopsis albispora TaxID=1804986 RepID=A0A344LHF1_9PSEU|nr:2-oxo acid dehydrogenase subunit E2 [Amycolatopsis albispora]AXB47475.1 acyltransferase [Amycolatopsis albispora]
MSFPAIARERRHTLYFLREIRRFSPVFLDTEIDMSRVVEHRERAKAAGERISVLTYVVHSAARVLTRHPEANAAVRGGLFAKVARFGGVAAKVTLDKRINGQRIVLSTVLTGVHEAGLAEIQSGVDHFRDGDAETMPEFEGARKLHRLPPWLGRVLFALAVRPLEVRAARFGTFAVTSLGHRPVDGFHSVGGTTVTLGLGRITDRPVVRGGVVTAAPVMRLSLAFDHRVIDGAEAADVLAELKESLEGFTDAHPLTPTARATTQESR